MDEAQIKAVQEKQAMLMMKRQIVASDSVLKDFNWKMNMPLDQSQVQKSGNAVLDHGVSREHTALQRDVRAPFVEFTFDLQNDDQARKDSEQISQSVSQLGISQSASSTALSSSNISKSQHVQFNKVQLQQFFEELEKIQIKLDELTA